MRVAALFVQRRGGYFDLPDVEPWDIARDARTYPGPWPVVAHPPCSRWCQLASINDKRYGHKVGDDGGCFAAALNAVRTWGGVLEHPAYSLAWPTFHLPRPKRGHWLYDGRGWVTEVSQVAYGHRAYKRTWLYFVGREAPPPLDWRQPPATAQVSYCKNHGNSGLPRLGKAEAMRTPAAFRAMLLALARGEKIPAPDLEAAEFALE